MKLKLYLAKLTKSLGVLSCVGGLLSGIIYYQNQLLKSEDKELAIKQYIQQENIDRANINALKNMPGFGFNNLIADWSWLQFLNYFGDGTVRRQIGYSLNPDFLESIVNHDPRFVRAYFLLAPATSIFAGEAERSVRAMNQGLKSITPDLSSEGFYLWVYKGVDEMMFLGDTEVARESYLTASAWAEQSNHPNAKIAVKNTKETAQSIKDRKDKKDGNLVGRIGAWTQVLNSAPDTETQDKALNKIKELGGEVIISPNGNVKIRVPENAT